MWHPSSRAGTRRSSARSREEPAFSGAACRLERLESLPHYPYAPSPRNLSGVDGKSVSDGSPLGEASSCTPPFGGAWPRPGRSRSAHRRLSPGAPPACGRGAAGVVYISLSCRRARRQDGLYFRFALGVGFGHDGMKSDRPLPPVDELFNPPDPLDASGTAFAAVTEVSLGFTPAPGFVIGI